MSKLAVLIVAVASAISLSSCTNLTTNNYEATARTIYTWQVKYSTTPSEKLPRFETFATNSVINRNGQKPQAAVKGPDERGLWWPALPPRPTVDQIEQRQRAQERPSPPELVKAEEYQITFQAGGQQKTLPTNYQVYRQVVKAHPSRTPLQLTLGVDDNSVTKAEVVN